MVSFSGAAQKRKQRLINEANEALTQLKSLEEGVLLVRLFNKSKAIQSMRNKGLEEAADKFEREAADKNQEIARAFQSQFTLCPVYFFYSDESEKVLNKNSRELTLIDYDLRPIDSFIDLTENEFFIAEFSNIETKDNETGQIEYGFSALIIRDSKFQILERPFPYYQRSYDGVMLVYKTPETVVRKWQESLLNFKQNPY